LARVLRPQAIVGALVVCGVLVQIALLTQPTVQWYGGLSGALHGLMRVRGFTQDDAHIFCTEDQVRDEVNACIRMVYDMYSTFGFEKIVVKLSTRPEKRIG
ncbi:hypothetical protein K4G95_21755, partial [Mycobacterium tuberculosis]|nr:hypothetical protein [Mycobacterium tuberculosis]